MRNSSFTTLVVTAYARLVLAATLGAAARRRDERGDVPGWVLVTVMTAGLVAGLTAIAGPQLNAMLQAALSSVNG
ncbi:hypothetical protein KLP28_09870 [Nocardioidaceae bacterium]|nr:hypothetical protein KLP28_09870 [Nocardioidaceae bacterium]